LEAETGKKIDYIKVPQKEFQPLQATQLGDVAALSNAQRAST
jgi:hypothetical protein